MASRAISAHACVACGCVGPPPQERLTHMLCLASAHACPTARGRRVWTDAMLLSRSRRLSRCRVRPRRSLRHRCVPGRRDFAKSVRGCASLRSIIHTWLSKFECHDPGGTPGRGVRSVRLPPPPPGDGEDRHLPPSHPGARRRPPGPLPTPPTPTAAPPSTTTTASTRPISPLRAKGSAWGKFKHPTTALTRSLP